MLEAADVGSLGFQLYAEFATEDTAGGFLGFGAGGGFGVLGVLVLAVAVGGRRQVNALVTGDSGQEFVNLRQRVFAEHIHRDALIFGDAHQLAAAAVMIFGGQQDAGAAQFVDDFGPGGAPVQGGFHFIAADAEQEDAGVQTAGSVAVGVGGVVEGGRRVVVVGVRFAAGAGRFAAATPAAP